MGISGLSLSHLVVDNKADDVERGEGIAIRMNCYWHSLSSPVRKYAVCYFKHLRVVVL